MQLNVLNIVPSIMIGALNFSFWSSHFTCMLSSWIGVFTSRSSSAGVSLYLPWTALIGAIGLLIAAVVKLQWSFWFDMFRYRSKLPGGSYGWPLLGETFSLLRSSPVQFAIPRVKKYGKVFKTHLYGEPIVVVTSPELGRALYSKPYEHVHLIGPVGSKRLLGEKAMHFLGDEDHEGIHKLVQSVFFLPSFGPHIPKIERLLVTQLDAWNGKILNSFQDIRKMAGRVLMRMLLGFEHEEDDHLLSELVELFAGPYYNGFFHIPLALPGSGYSKGLKAREKMAEIINLLIDKWENSSDAVKSQNCVLKQLLEYKLPSTGERISRRSIVDNLIVISFAGFDTTPSTFSSALKHVWENSNVLELVKAEQEALAKRRHPGEPLTLDDLNSMKYTDQVLHETLRFPGPVSFSYRQVTHDITIDGYFVPKGWKVANFFGFNHQDPSLFPNPTDFDPSRFDGRSRNLKGFTPFGGGRHLCPGREQAKVNFKILMHYLFTKFRWEPVNFEPGYQYVPVLMTSPKGGFPIKLSLISDPQS